MIVQTWQGLALITNATQCLRFLNEQVLPSYQAADGNLGVYLCQEVNGQLVSFLFLSIWMSREALRKFTGMSIESAVHSQGEQKFLLAFESTARNYEVFKLSE